MNYQLVLQFTANSMADFDRLVALETKLMGSLGDFGFLMGTISGPARPTFLS